MEITLRTYLIVCPLIFLAGLIDSIAGGGGLVSLPAYLFAGLPPHLAIATNKLSSSLGTIISVIRYYKNKCLDIQIALVSALCSLIGSVLGSNLALITSEAVIKYMMIPILPIVAYYVLKNKDFDAIASNGTITTKQKYIFCMIISLVIGCYDGFYGPGTGTFLILLYTGLAKIDVRTASGNSKLVNLASNIGALATFILNGKVLFVLGLPAAFFCIAGHYLGSGLAVKNGSKIIRPIILIVLFLLFIKIILLQ